MTRYCLNILVVKGNSRKELEQFYEANYKNKHQPLSFDKLVPINGDKNENKNENEDKDENEDENGLNQLECCESWGTKWDAMDFETIGLDENAITYKFYTARSPPDIWISKVALLFPKLLFELEYSEPVSNFWGKQIYEKGWMIDEEYESLGERNWRLCDKDVLERKINENMDLITINNYLLRIDNIVDDYAFEANHHENIEIYVESIVEKKLGLKPILDICNCVL